VESIRATQTPATAVTAKTPTGIFINVPATRDDDFAYFKLDQADEIRRYYDDYGYVVIRDLIPKDVCRAARQTFEQEVKPFEGFIYRQTTCNPERHIFTEHGFMVNPILNVQSLDPRHLAKFRLAGLAVVTHPNLQGAVRVLYGGRPGKLVQSMYFEGNPVTWAHQDTYYLDAEQLGRMVGAWIAMEPIAAGAGRFFVYPKTHRLDLMKNGRDQDVGFNHARYKQYVLDIISRNEFECRAPALGEGDVLFWGSKTVHGSLQTTNPQVSRRSFTSHFIPESSRFLQWQSRIKALDLEEINGIKVHKPKDLAKARNRRILWVETTFPKPFQTAKKVVTKLVTR
jgi:phytanoyl-CoA hydroxylase